MIDEINFIIISLLCISYYYRQIVIVVGLVLVGLVVG